MGLMFAFLSIQRAQEVTVTAYAFSSAPVIDGVIDEGWTVNSYQPIEHLLSLNDTIAPEDFSGSFKISWYDNELYFLFVVTDDILMLNEGQPIWLGDNINLYLDLGNEKSETYDDNDYLCHFKWGNSEYYERYNGEDLIQIDNSADAVEFAQTCDTMNHTFIMEIVLHNLADMNGPAVLDETTSIGLDAGLYDADEEPGFYSDQLSWVDTTGLAWMDPSKLGTSGFGSVVLKSAQNPDELEGTSGTPSIQLFPTPTSESLHIRTDYTEDLYVEMIDLSGRRVGSWVLDPGDTDIDIGSLDAGLYLVNLFDRNGLIHSQKIILSR